MERENFIGKMVKSIQVNGLTEWKTVQGCGNQEKETHTLDTGKKEKSQVMVCMWQTLNKDMKDSLKIFSSMGQERKNFQMEITFKECT